MSHVWGQIETRRQESVEHHARKVLGDICCLRQEPDTYERLGRALHCIMIATATLQLRKDRDADWQVEISPNGVKSVGTSDYDWEWYNDFGRSAELTVEGFEALADKLQAKVDETKP